MLVYTREDELNSVNKATAKANRVEREFGLDSYVIMPPEGAAILSTMTYRCT